MTKFLLSLTLVVALLMSFGSVALAGSDASPGQVCRNGLAATIEGVLEDFLLAHIGQEVDLDVSQGACASLIATHMNPAGQVNATALATDVCKSLVPAQARGENLRACVEHVEPGLFFVFHGG